LPILAVGAIPEGLPAIVTIALAIGVQRMAARQAIVRKLPAVETLGSTTTICTDKTGTLTRNEMTVQALWLPEGLFEITGVGYEPKGELKREGQVVAHVPATLRTLLVDGALCNDSAETEQDGQWTVPGDPTEGALVTAAMKLGIAVTRQRDEHQRVDVVPFESENQFMATLHSLSGGGRRLILKGAPEVVLRRCDAAPTLQEVAIQALHELTSRGMRVLALVAKAVPDTYDEVAADEISGGREFVGLQARIDPPRREAIDAVRACHAAGISVRMITGDHQGTALAIGRQLGLIEGEDRAVAGTELETTSDSDLQD